MVRTAIAFGLAVSLAACGSSPTPGTSTSQASESTIYRDAIAFSNCVRSHGLPAFPDPDADGDIPKAKVLPLSHAPALRDATRACSKLMPTAAGRGGVLTSREIAQLRNGMVKFASCIRSDGVTTWPDPSIGRQERPVFNLSNTDPASPAVTADIEQCRHEMPGSIVPYICTRARSQQMASATTTESCIGGPAYQYTR